MVEPALTPTPEFFLRAFCHSAFCLLPSAFCLACLHAVTGLVQKRPAIARRKGAQYCDPNHHRLALRSILVVIIIFIFITAPLALRTEQHAADSPWTALLLGRCRSPASLAPKEKKPRTGRHSIDLSFRLLSLPNSQFPHVAQRPRQRSGASFRQSCRVILTILLSLFESTPHPANFKLTLSPVPIDIGIIRTPLRAGARRQPAKPSFEQSRTTSVRKTSDFIR